MDMSNQQEASASCRPTLVVDKTRVRDAAGYRGTVAYVGSVASASDPNLIYAGIVWDDPERGKHNGTVVSKTTGQLVSHFSCPHSTGASFVKVNKLDTGTVLTPGVLQERYVPLDSDERVAGPDNCLPHTAATASGKDNKPIELLGELKIRKYQQVADLQTLSLRLSGLSSIDMSASWKTAAQQVRHLDLAGNLYCDWTVLPQILQCLPALETLSLASNRLGNLNTNDDDTSLAMPRQPQYGTLKNLNVRDCHIGSVSTLLALGRLLPKLNEIGMGQACLVDLNATEHQADLAIALPNLKVLDLSQGQLKESSQIEALAALPSLESLSLDENPIDQWPTKAAETESTAFFNQLRHLQLAGTMISSWAALEGLRNCRQCQSLRLRSTPLTETAGPAARSQLIARFPSLVVLNASPVSSLERQEAERRYVANVTRLLQKAKKDQANDKDQEASILADHPTYTRLAREHDTVLESIRAESTNGKGGHHMSSSWSDSLATVTIRSMAAQSCEQAPLIRRLPATLTIRQVKALLARHFGLDWDLQELRLQNAGEAFPDTVLGGPNSSSGDDDESLFAYGVADGATIYMHEVDVKARQQEVLRQQQAQEEKLRQQEQEIHDYMQIQKKMADM